VLGNLAALAGERRPEADTPESRLAAALHALGEEDSEAPYWQEGLVAPLAASLGAPLLAPLAEGLRAVGNRRLAHAARLQAELVLPLETFVNESLKGVAAARAAYARRSREADVSREALVRLGRATDARARSAAAEAHADAAMARDAARAALAAAVTHAEGARRHAVLRAVVSAMQALQEHAQAVSSDLAALSPAVEAASQFAEQAALQSEKRAAAQSEGIQAFMAARQAECEAAKAAAVVQEGTQPQSAPAPNEGRSSADSSLRQQMATGGVAPVREGWLMLRAAGGWHRRYVLVEGSGVLSFSRTREGAVAASRGRYAAAATRPQGKAAAPLPDAGSAEPGEESEGEGEGEVEAGLLARAVTTGMWSMGTSLLRGARSLAETAGELASAAGQRVAAPAGGALHLLTASVKLGPPEGDAQLRSLPFVFRLLSPQPGASLTLQAESAAERAAWVGALQGVIAELLSGAGRLSAAPLLAALRAAPGNGRCADCGCADPDWASLNLAVLLCQRCAGAHRRLGAAVSAVRSLNLDEDAWTPSVCALFAALGNDAANAAWASSAEEAAEALTPQASMESRLEAVRAKYVDRLHVLPALAQEAAAEGALTAAAAAGSLPRVMRLLAAGASVEATPQPLAAAVAAGAALVVQALLLNGADACAPGPDGASLLDLVPGDAQEAPLLRELLSSATARQRQGRSLAAKPAPAAEPVTASEPAVSPEPDSYATAAACESFATVALTPLKQPGPPEPATADAAEDDESWLADAPTATPGGSKLPNIPAEDDAEWSGA